MTLNPRKESALLITLMLVMFTTIVDFMIMMPLASYLMAEMHVNTAQFGLLVSSYSLAAGCSALLASSQADRFDRRHALLFCYAGLMVATLACGMASGFVSLLLARILAGIFGGVIGSICMAIVGDVIPAERRGHAMGWVMLGFSISAVAGVPLGLWLAANAGWRVPFLGLTLICAVVAVGIMRFVPPVRAHLASLDQNASWLDNYRELLSDRNHWWAVSLTAMLMVSGFLVIPFIAPTMVANIGISQHDLMYVYLVGGAGTIFSRPIIGNLSDRYPKKHVVGALIVLSFIPIILVTQSLALGLGWQLLISLLFFVFVSGRFIPATAMVTGATRPHLRGRLMAFNSAVQNFASGAASLLAGLILTQEPNGHLAHYGWIGLISCGAGLVAIWLARQVKAVS
ncbi:MFS transporter [Chitinibacter bivalviorum]|uniref:MFS transporter n=1 Tax=Chitinibacter bivalviorum TaxID=2739434 RepID=A0A7H9BL45_9NEIS|nr:MFS transporter [Chitinibacter bivalviorum]QLG89066.1 MFS transporter [Chitinibacter bivalviorum]